MKWTRRILIGLGILAVLVVGLYIAAHVYLGSSAVVRQAETQLSQTLGAKVRVKEVDTGLFSDTRLEGVQLYENEESNEPWLELGNIKLDVTAIQLARGAMPTAVQLDSPRIRLRFDREGNLLTRLPEPKGGETGFTIPAVNVSNGMVTLEQQGRPPFTVQGVSATLTDKGTKVTGSVADPRWGEGDLEATLDLEKATASIKVIAKGTNVDKAKLAELPLVSPAVWEAVQIDGPMGGVIVWRLGADTTGHYRIDLDARGCKVRVAAVELEATNVRGGAVVEDGQVTLSGLTGQTDSGSIATDGNLDFREDVYNLRFKTKVARVDWQKFTKTWPLPEQLRRVSGKLTGQADLLVKVGEEVDVSGEGQGKIEDARLADIPLDGPMEIRLFYDNGKPRFSQQRPMSRLPVPIPATVFLAKGVTLPVRAVAQEERPPLVTYPARAVSLLGQGVNLLGKGIADAGRELDRFLKERKPAEEPPTYVETRFGFRDVDLAQLVDRLGVKLPFPVAGRSNLQVEVALPIDRPRDLAAYRAKGTVELTRLRLADLEVENLNATVRLEKGLLQLEQLKGRVPDQPSPGTFEGTARVQLEPPGEASARLDVKDLSLTRVFSVVPNLAGSVKGVIAGNVEWSAPADKLGDPNAWKGKAAIQVNRGELFGLSVDTVSVDASLDRGQLTASSIRTGLYKGEVTGTATFDLRGTGSVDLKMKDVDLGALTGAIKDFPVKIEGRTGGRLEGKLVVEADKPVFTTKLDLEAPRLRVQNVPAERLRGTVTVGKTEAEYKLEADALGGTVEIDGKLPLGQPKADPPQGKSEGTIRFRGVRLGRLWRPLGFEETLAPLRGIVDLNLRYEQAADGTFNGTGRVEARSLFWGKSELRGRAAGDLRLRRNVLSLGELTGELGGGTVRLNGAWHLKEPERSWATLSLDNVESASLFSIVPGLDGLVQGPMSATVRTSLGRDWNGHGEVSLARARVISADVSDWRLPFTFTYSPERGSGRLEIRESLGQLAMGRVDTQLSLGFGDTTQLDGSIRFTNVELNALLKKLNGIGVTVGHGRATGRLEFSGRDVRTADDLSGRLSVSFKKTQALEFPVLKYLTPYLGGYSGATTFDNGELRATLGRGLWLVHALALDSPVIRLFAEGTVSLEGRLNLEVIARTGQVLVEPAVLRLLGLSIGGPISSDALARASAWLSNRTVQLHVSGTTRSPVIRLQPIRLLTQEAVRFFLMNRGVPSSFSQTLRP